MSDFFEIDISSEIRRYAYTGDYEGFFKDQNGQMMYDRRMTQEGMERRGLNPRIADLNLIGPVIVPVPEDLIEEMQLDYLYLPERKM
jgi:hypothetical protein